MDNVTGVDIAECLTCQHRFCGGGDTDLKNRKEHICGVEGREGKKKEGSIS